MFQLQLTEGQAQAVAEALELYTRMGLGQVDFLAEQVRMSRLVPEFSAKPLADAERKPLSVRQIDEIETACAAIRRALKYPGGASYGVGSPAVSLPVHRAYEVSCVVRKALAEQRGISAPHVDLDGLVVRYTSDPAPVCKVTPSP